MTDTPFKSGFVALVGRPQRRQVDAAQRRVRPAHRHHEPRGPDHAQAPARRREHAHEPRSSSWTRPGLHKPKDALGKELNRAALGELSDVDVVAMLVDATKPVGTGDEWVGAHVDKAHAPKILVLTKADIAKPDQMQAQLEAASKLAHFDDVIVTSATEGFNVDAFLALVSEKLPEGPKWFPDDMDSDATEEDLVAEFVRREGPAQLP